MRWTSDDGLAELSQYLGQLCRWIQVLVVDGSSPELFSRHAKAFPPAVRHVPPMPWPGANGKVAGVMTGIQLAAGELLVLADDNVNYASGNLTFLLGLLADADIVRPQNHFAPLPWHARHDTARSLINRAWGGDYPGTFGVRRSAVLATAGYDGNVLFENLELLRTVKAAGGRERLANNLFVRRLPPTTSHFLHQRIRQAYDGFAQPLRVTVELSLLPLSTVALSRAIGAHRPRPVMLTLAVSCLLAGIGRCRDGGTQVFGKTAPLWAPLWVLERSFSVWAAVYFRFPGGIPYAGGTLCKAANSPRILRARHNGMIF